MFGQYYLAFLKLWSQIRQKHSEKLTKTGVKRILRHHNPGQQVPKEELPGGEVYAGV